MKKVFIFVSLTLGAFYFIWPLFESPESRVKKRTLRLLEQSLPKNPKSESARLSHLAKLSSFFHFDVQLRAEYQGGRYQADSLNELRSLLLAWLRQKKSHLETVDYRGLTVQALLDEEGGDRSEIKQGSQQEIEPQPTVFSKFELIFKREGEQEVSCKARLEWTKDKKKWRIKKARISSCFVEESL